LTYYYLEDRPLPTSAKQILWKTARKLAEEALTSNDEWVEMMKSLAERWLK
jgi:hypothetical protein